MPGNIPDTCFSRANHGNVGEHAMYAQLHATQVTEIKQKRAMRVQLMLLRTETQAEPSVTDFSKR